MPPLPGQPTREHDRIYMPRTGPVAHWHRWGPYVSDRAWGTVREDYSPNGDAWNYLPHDLARSKAYRWGEDGIAGICDRYQLLIFALALWNGRDPILKERLFGLNGPEGNHGEDVKEYYFYLDSTPTYSYLKYLYKYPQAEFPYGRLVEENRRRAGGVGEYELLDTGVFAEDRYFDVFVEYAKAAPEDICIRIEAINRGPQEAELHVLPHLWFRNTWAWTDPPGPEPAICPGPTGREHLSLMADNRSAKPPEDLQFAYRLGVRYLYGPVGGELLFTDNETNGPRVRGSGAASRKPCVKDAFHRYIVNGEHCVRADHAGTKACAHYTLRVPAGKSVILPMRLTPAGLEEPPVAPLAEVDTIVKRRKQEADEFYATLHAPQATPEERMIQRQALSGMLWSKQIYLFDVEKWLDGDNPKNSPPASRKKIRNVRWRHLHSTAILPMPDKWEYPWFAAWDLPFACVTLALVDPPAAKESLEALLSEEFQHPSGQIPACEWEFSDGHPPVQAWACWRVYQMEKQRTGRTDRDFLERCFQKLLMNFAWWVNRQDSQGRNVFEGGFLGLDNFAVVNPSEPLPGGAILEQSDATGWVGFFCLAMMRLALELARQNQVYEGLATKFFEHFLYLGAAMKNRGGRCCALWDEEDGFFYDVLRYPNGDFNKFRVRSLAGLIPMFAVETLREDELSSHPNFMANVTWLLRNRPELAASACHTEVRNGTPCHLLSLVDQRQLTKILERVFDANEFLSPAGIRSLSKAHERQPFVFDGVEVRYEPAEARVKIKGGNSNWRGPVWFPMNFLILESLGKFSEGFGNKFTMTTAGTGGKPQTLRALARDLADRLIGLFRRDGTHGRRVYGRSTKMQIDPHWRDYLLFHEYFHGDTGAGLGASHHTGWTGLVANLIDEWR